MNRQPDLSPNILRLLNSVIEGKPVSKNVLHIMIKLAGFDRGAVFLTGKNKALKLAINTGLRKMELFSLQWADLNFQQRVIMVRESKSGESRTVPMNATVMDAFKSIVRRIDSPFVFPGNLPGTQRTDLPKSWEKFLETAGIKNFVWHDLRHTFGSRLAMKRVDIYTISKLMGHKTITMTQRYAHLSPGYLQEAVNVLDQSASGTKMGTGGV